MKIPSLLVSLLTLACVSTSQLTAAEAPALGCPVGLDWAGGFVNLGRPSTAFPTQDTALTNAPDCVFHQWSWEAFVWATAPSSNGVLRFMNLRTEDEFKLSATAARSHPGKLVLKPRALKPPTMSRKVARAKALSLTGSAENVDEFLQASGGVLVDTNGNAVYYTVNMNDTYFNFARKYVGSNGYNTASASLNFPVGSAVFKSAWQVVPPSQIAAYRSNFYVTAASVPMLTNTWDSGTNTGVATVPGKTRDVTVALVGLHVVGVTTNHAEFVWGTFEQVSNAPFLPPGMSPTSTQAVSSNNATFYQAGTSALNCNGNVYSSGFSVPPPTLQNYAAQIFTPNNNVFLRHRYGGSNAENAYDIENLNKVSQAELVKLKSIFSNYALVGTVWMAPNSLSTNSSNINTFGSTNLANSVMETFVQGSRLTPTYANCFVCHSPQPKNINISHVVYFPN